MLWFIPPLVNTRHALNRPSKGGKRKRKKGDTANFKLSGSIKEDHKKPLYVLVLLSVELRRLVRCSEVTYGCFLCLPEASEPSTALEVFQPGLATG